MSVEFSIFLFGYTNAAKIFFSPLSFSMGSSGTDNTTLQLNLVEEVW